MKEFLAHERTKDPEIDEIGDRLDELVQTHKSSVIRRLWEAELDLENDPGL